MGLYHQPSKATVKATSRELVNMGPDHHEPPKAIVKAPHPRLGCSFHTPVCTGWEEEIPRLPAPAISPSKVKPARYSCCDSHDAGPPRTLLFPFLLQVGCGWDAQGSELSPWGPCVAGPQSRASRPAAYSEAQNFHDETQCSFLKIASSFQ